MDRSTLRIALRTLGRHRGFTLIAILSLAVAISLNTVMYSVLDAMIDPIINARRPDNIYDFWYYGNFRKQLDPTVIEDALLKGMSGNVESVTGWTSYGVGFRGEEPLVENGPRYKRIRPRIVRPNYFDFLGTIPLEGRTFRPSDHTEGGAAAVISDRLATKLFPDESPIGKTVALDGRGYTVVGVVQRNIAFWPLAHDFYLLPPTTASAVRVRFIRLRERVDPIALDQMFKMAAARLAFAADEKTSWTAFRGRAILDRKFRPNSFHLALICAVGAVLLVACANLANLQLARGLSRSRELALRAAVGASRGQLVRLLVLESGILATAGLVLGVLMTFWGIHLVGSWIPESIEFNGYVIQPQVSWSMFVFAAIAALVCLFLVGLVPALHVSRVDPNDLLKSGAGTGASRHHRRRYGAMVVAQIGFALPLLIGAIIVMKSAVELHSRGYLLDRFGYDPSPLARGSVPFVGKGQRMPAADVAADVLSRARLVPGVVDVAASFDQSPAMRAVTVDDATGDMREEMAHLWSYKVVTPSYLRTYARPLERGRDFVEGDLSSNVVMVDRPTATFLWKNADPVGRAIKFGNKDSDLPWYRVIGIVGDRRDTNMIRKYSPDANYRLFGVYRLMKASDSLATTRLGYGGLSVIARLSGSAELGAVRMQRQLRAFRSDRPAAVTPLINQLGVGFEQERTDFVGSLFMVFAALGLALVAIGVFGIVTHSVEERRREIAVRISLGATPRNILHSVLREGNVLILAGIAIGLLFTKYSIWWLGQFFAENDGYNALLMALIAMLLFGLAVIAAFIPALRATRIDPVEALRSE